MKRLSLLVVFLIAAASLQAGGTKDDESKIVYEMPAKVKSIFENKCYGCHNDEGKSEKAVKALNFDSFSSLEKIQKIATLNEVKKTLDENEMPPQKFLNSHPEAALSGVEKMLLVEWVKAESSSLLKD